ncbi:hypothetical protein, partial [Phocaeicola fibrisolvens]|uniref:hypothetical protein n=1 Tax=Phocaeicola fibrisolvens TaxID=2981793 RepID=UPI0021D284A0
ESPFFANRRTRISRKRPVLRQPEDEKNEPGDHFFHPAGKSRPKFLPRKAKNPKKIPEKLETELHVHKQNRDFSMQQGK